MTRHLRHLCIGSALLSLPFSGQALAALSVGNAAGCQYATIQAAINAAAPDDSIHVEPSHTYFEHLLIVDKSLQISACACGESVCTTKSHAVVDGTTAIKNLNPLLRIQTTGSNSITVGLSNVDFSNARSAVDGGGIAWSAQGQLTLSDVLVTGNHALNGGGIYFNGLGTGAQLTFGDNVAISSNLASGSGGGVRIEGLTTLTMNSGNDRIFQNTADSDGNDDGDGGGISIVSPATATIGTVVAGNAVIYANTAYNGGGIALVGGAVDSGVSTDTGVTVQSSDPHYPVRLESNTATHFGGGIYLRPKMFASATINAVHFSASGYRIDANTAFDGSAIYADTDSSTGVGDAGGKVTLSQTTCLADVECNTIAGNLYGPYGIGGTPASVVAIKTGGQFNAFRVRMHDNAGEHLLQSSGARAAVQFSLLYGNHVADALIAGDSGSQHLQIVQCTIAGNTIQGAQVLSGNVEILDNSLIDQPATAAYAGSGIASAFNLVATDSSGLPADPTIKQQQPLFLDAANDDFRLLVQRSEDGTISASPGVDYAAAGPPAQIDIAGRSYDQDMPDIGSAGNVRDLGAFEMQPITDRIFASGVGDPVLLAY